MNQLAIIKTISLYNDEDLIQWKIFQFIERRICYWLWNLFVFMFPLKETSCKVNQTTKRVPNSKPATENYKETSSKVNQTTNQRRSVSRFQLNVEEHIFFLAQMVNVIIALVEMKFDWKHASSNLQIISLSLVLNHQQVTYQSCTL